MWPVKLCSMKNLHFLTAVADVGKKENGNKGNGKKGNGKTETKSE